jgi:hypothetical protein
MALMRFVLAAAGLAVVAPQEPAVPNVVIDHEPVDCVLAGQPPALNACFAPAEEIVRARVYYRLGEAAWQFAPLVPEGSCFGAVLPRPTRTDGTLRYYLEAVDLASQSTKSSEYRALVVQDRDACAGVLAAVRPGPTQVASAGRKKTLPLILIGAGAAGAGAALAGGGGGGGGGASTTQTTSSPATVTLTMSSTTPESSTTTTPGSSSTTTLPGSTTTTQPGSTTTTTPSTTTTTPTTPTTTLAPTTTTQPCAYAIDPAESPLFGSGGGSGSFNLTTGAACSWSLEQTAGWVSLAVSSGTGSRNVGYDVPGYLVGYREAFVSVTGFAGARIKVRQDGLLLRAEPAGTPGLVTDLSVAGGSGQIVWNGASVTYAAEGRTSTAALLQPGPNRVEALLVAGGGRPGTWRFSFPRGVRGLRPVAGRVDAATPDVITFRLSGRAGERVVFVFETEP